MQTSQIAHKVRINRFSLLQHFDGLHLTEFTTGLFLLNGCQQVQFVFFGLTLFLPATLPKLRPRVLLEASFRTDSVSARGAAESSAPRVLSFMMISKAAARFEFRSVSASRPLSERRRRTGSSSAPMARALSMSESTSSCRFEIVWFSISLELHQPIL